MWRGAENPGEKRNAARISQKNNLDKSLHLPCINEGMRWNLLSRKRSFYQGFRPGLRSGGCGTRRVKTHRYTKSLKNSLADHGKLRIKKTKSSIDHEVDMIVTPCSLYQSNFEIHHDEINQKFGSNFNMSVVYYGQLISVANGRSVKDAALDGQVI